MSGTKQHQYVNGPRTSPRAVESSQKWAPDVNNCSTQRASFNLQNFEIPPNVMKHASPEILKAYSELAFTLTIHLYSILYF